MSEYEEPELLVDTSPANWLDQTYRRATRGAIADLVPDSFEAYTRIFMPARDHHGREWRWAELTVGQQLTAATSWRSVTETVTANAVPELRAPLDGRLDRDRADALARCLAPPADETVFFAVWDGWGYPKVRSLGEGRLTLEQDRFHLFAGTIGSLRALLDSDLIPMLWWPANQRWCVVTPMDGYSTYVGGSQLVADRILGDSVLEAVPAAPHDTIDTSPL